MKQQKNYINIRFTVELARIPKIINTIYTHILDYFKQLPTCQQFTVIIDFFDSSALTFISPVSLAYF